MQSKRDDYRATIDDIDDEIIALVDYRIDMMQMIDLWNQQNHIPSDDPARCAEVKERYTDCLGSIGASLSNLLQSMDF